MSSTDLFRNTFRWHVGSDDGESQLHVGADASRRWRKRDAPAAVVWFGDGHGIEAAWFVMDIAARRGDKTLIHQCIDIALSLLDFGWDPVHGGLFYFLDCENRPPDRLDWDLKLWWVHLESLVAFAKGYALTGRRDCAEAFARVHDYAWDRFPDPQYGEWFGYLNRRGEVLIEAKGGKWKGCFHVPRALWLVSQAAANCAGEKRQDPDSP